MVFSLADSFYSERSRPQAVILAGTGKSISVSVLKALHYFTKRRRQYSQRDFSQSHDNELKSRYPDSNWGLSVLRTDAFAKLGYSG
jgi:hypothetical protein